jgi:hypothetical protein
MTIQHTSTTGGITTGSFQKTEILLPIGATIHHITSYLHGENKSSNRTYGGLRIEWWVSERTTDGLNTEKRYFLDWGFVSSFGTLYDTGLSQNDRGSAPMSFNDKFKVPQTLSNPVLVTFYEAPVTTGNIYLVTECTFESPHDNTYSSMNKHFEEIYS